jgi:hypothetical protein
MNKKLLFVIPFLLIGVIAYAGQVYNPFTGKFDIIPTVTTVAGTPRLESCQLYKFPDGSVTDNEDGSCTINPGEGTTHDAVTLSAAADTLLSLSTQEIGLDTQTANRVFAGPTTGDPATPTFRALTSDDIPDLSGTYVTGTPWTSEGYLTDINWDAFPNTPGFITQGDINWDAFPNNQGYITGVNWAEIPLLTDANINWLDFDVPAANLPVNSSTSAGIVATGAGQNAKVWKTDASGNPDWRTDSDTFAGYTLSGTGTVLPTTVSPTITTPNITTSMTVTRDNLTTNRQTPALALQNTTAATADATQQNTPALLLSGQGWHSSTNKQLQWAISALPISVAGTLDDTTLRFYSKVGTDSWSVNPYVLSATFGAYMYGSSIGQNLSNSNRLSFYNNTNATSSVNQYSPYMRYFSHGWKTAATAASQIMAIGHVNAPEQGTISPIGVHKWFYGINTATPVEANELLRLQWGSDAGATKVKTYVPLEATVDSATTNAITDILTVQSTTTGTAAIGIGAGQKFMVENSGGTTTEAGRLQARLTAADGSASAVDIGAGAATQAVTVLSSGRVGIGTTTPDYDLTVKTGGTFGIGTTQWNSGDGIDGTKIVTAIKIQGAVNNCVISVSDDDLCASGLKLAEDNSIAICMSCAANP